MPENLELLIKWNKIWRQANRTYQTLASRNHLSESAFEIFYVVGILGDGCLQRDVCETAVCSKQTINSSAKKLEREGFLRLIGGRGRAKHIFLTEKGRAVLESVAMPVIAAECDGYEELSVREQNLLLVLTEKYINAVRKRLGT